MAAADKASQTTTSEQITYASQRGRDRLARLVVVGSFLTLFILVGVLIGLAQNSSKEASDAAKNVFTAVLPVLAGWVGTVLAFYFSAASHQASIEALKPSPSPAPGTPVSEKMIPVSSIVGLQKLEDKQPNHIKIKADLLDVAFEKQLPNGEKVTRLLFLERGAFRYIMHRAALDKFVAKDPDPSAALNKTFADVLGDPETLRQISKLVVFVSARATLGDAKAALDKVSGAQDVIVTESGNATEPMLGWLSNVDLTKALQAS